VTNYGQSANSSGVLLSALGDSYNIASFTPSLVENNVRTPGTIMVGDPIASLTAAGFPSPVMRAQGTAVGGGAQSEGSLLYSFEVTNGKSAISPVNIAVDVSGFVAVTTSGNSRVHQQQRAVPNRGTDE